MYSRTRFVLVSFFGRKVSCFGPIVLRRVEDWERGQTFTLAGGRRKKEGGRRKDEGGRREEEGRKRRKEEGGRKEEEGGGEGGTRQDFLASPP
jgi:hypothetical protein